MAQLEAIARRVKGACELLELPDCGHAPFKDKPEQVLNSVVSFIRNLPKQ
jgi:pimeloyl-ACP methyl ester carboxylesterase